MSVDTKYLDRILFYLEMYALLFFHSRQYIGCSVVLFIRSLSQKQNGIKKDRCEIQSDFR